MALLFSRMPVSHDNKQPAHYSDSAEWNPALVPLIIHICATFAADQNV